MLSAHIQVYPQQLPVARGHGERSDQILEKREDPLYPPAHRGSNGCDFSLLPGIPISYSVGAPCYLSVPSGRSYAPRMV